MLLDGCPRFRIETGSLEKVKRRLSDRYGYVGIKSNNAMKHDGAYQIISAYRSSTTNAQLRSRSIGTSEHSVHMEGKAIDVRLVGFSTLKLRDLAMSLRRRGVEFYAASDFVHIDTGRVRYCNSYDRWR